MPKFFFHSRDDRAKMETPEEEYILKWRDYQSNFFSLAEDLFLNEMLTDVTLCCRDQVRTKST